MMKQSVDSWLPKRLLLCCATIMLFFGLLPAAQGAEPAVKTAPEIGKRVALVVGMSHYEFIQTLDNPKNDAKLIAKTLKELGFTLIGGDAQLDLDKEKLDRAIQSFGKQVTGADVAFFYYAGHGIQARDANWLVPVNANPTVENDLDFQMVDAQLVLRQMEAAHTRLNVVVLDACRNNPFGGRGLRATTGGLAQMRTPEGTLISYATQPGNTAQDGRDGDSPYTKALAETLRTPGLEVQRVFNQVGLKVKKATNGTQQPWLATSPIDGDFYFAGTPPKSATPLPSVQPAPVEPTLGPAKVAEDAAWHAAQSGNTVGSYAAYLKQYRHGAYAATAGINMATLTAPSPVLPPPAVAQQNKPSRHQPGETFRDCSDICPDLIVIPSGSFMMGSPVDEEGRQNDEGPLHQVHINSFALGKTDVTVGQFQQFVNATGYQTDAERNAGNLNGCFAWDTSDGKFDWRTGRNWHTPGWEVKENEPVVCVSYNDAQVYINWLNNNHNGGYRLPSEAEWEYAARASTTTARFWGDDPSQACAYANVSDQTIGPSGQRWARKHECNDGYWFVSPVGSFRPNGFGLYDMLGNVWQWTSDCYNPSYTGAPKDGSAWASGQCAVGRVLRGGSWFNEPEFVRSATRNRLMQTFRYYLNGFRVARAL